MVWRLFHGLRHPVKKHVWRGTPVASVNWAHRPLRYWLEIKMTLGRPHLGLARLSVWSVALRSCDERDLCWCRALQGSKVLAAECNNQSSPPLIRYLSVCSRAERQRLSTCRIFRVSLNMENIDETMTTSNSPRDQRHTLVCAALLHRTFHTLFNMGKIHNTVSCECSAVLKAWRLSWSNQDFLLLSQQLPFVVLLHWFTHWHFQEWNKWIWD